MSETSSIQSPRIPVLHPVEVHLPKELASLYDLAHNLWWSWNPEARRVFSAIRSESWSRYRNPVELMLSMDRAHWETLAENEVFVGDLQQVSAQLDAYLEGAAQSWFAQRYPDWPGGVVAYFSMEYGFHQTLALYSGGLGILSGDHCKSASDLGVPFVAVGLLYRSGYFRQTIDADGMQQHFYPENDFVRLGVRPVATATGSDLIVEVPFPGRKVAAKVWTLQIGRVPLLLLDTDIRQNEPADRPITHALYVRGREMRLAQELLLGAGGVRALEALDIDPALWHLNEGHSSLLQLERLSRQHRLHGRSLTDAVREIREDTVFTTHTPVPAGHETFDADLARHYLAPWADALDVDVETVLSLGNSDHGEPGQPLNLTALAMRTSCWVNGVSQLNAEVIEPPWRHLFPDLPAGQPAVHAITNGVHVPTWIGIDMREMLTRALGPEWLEDVTSPDRWLPLDELPGATVWQAHQQQKRRLQRFVRSHVLRQYARHGRSPDELRQVEGMFDEDTLTIGFARRFATYKRASLLFSDLHRVRAMLCHHDCPIQVVFAGKAHPADRLGQELIQHLFHLSLEDQLQGRVFFLENYDIAVAKMLVQGCDVWLNTPRRPLEASGTSGMKAAMNGVLNFSILDGWWPEGFDGLNGWAIDGGRHHDESTQDREDALALYQTLENEIVPTYYQRDESGLPGQWIQRMKRSIATVTPQFSSNRMVRDYVERAYEPHARRPEPAESTAG